MSSSPASHTDREWAREDPTSAPAFCWSTIGVLGDHSCPELAAAIHCRNCAVFATAAQRFLDRPAPPGYLAEWTRFLGGPDDQADTGAARQGMGLVIFRVGPEYLALKVACVAEVTPVRPVHRIPHRSNEVLLGLVNLRGQLYLCASMHKLLGTAAAERGGQGAASEAASRRMIVIRQEADSWVFTADEVLGVPRVPPELLQGVPSTLANPAVSFSQATFTWHGQSVGLLDEIRVFAALGSQGP